MKKNKGEKLSYYNLILKYPIEIPIIQRDYAQGRTSKVQIRKVFLNELYNRLNDEKNIDLDFVYGSIHSNNFIPLDGQQRLTTLFLLHWYLAHLDDRYSEFEEVHQDDDKVRFSYKTRTSSTDFCKHLICKKLDLTDLMQSDKLLLSDVIKDCSWYFYSWINDTTVAGMLVMLDAIHAKFRESTGFYERLINETDPIITFYFLDLKDFKLTDDLYIKMNARGKPLTKFENFKAKFEKFIHEHHNTVKADFSRKIDGKWCDLFWELADKESGKTGYDLIDKSLMNFISFITDMLYHKGRDEDDPLEIDFFDKLEQVYQERENLDLLIFSLDQYSSGDKKFTVLIKNYFSELFSTDYQQGKVCLFQQETNLFDKCIKNVNFEHFDKLLLFALIYFSWKSNLDSLIANDSLKDYLRIARNFILKIRQSKKNEYVTNIRVENYTDIIKTFEAFCDPSDPREKLILAKDKLKYQVNNIHQEIIKSEFIKQNPEGKTLIYQLEDHYYLRGAIHNFLPFCTSISKTQFLVDSFFQLWDDKFESSLLKRGLIAFGDYSAHIGNSRWGHVKFFGEIGRWNRVLTNTSKKVNEVFLLFFNKLYDLEGTLSSRLENIIEKQLSELNNEDWKYYFLKYSNITKQERSFYIFYWHALYIEYSTGISLRYLHINAYILAVFQMLKSNITIIKTDKCWKKNEEDSSIYCRNKIELTPSVDASGDYWQVKTPKKMNLKEVKFKGKLTTSTGSYENHYRYYRLTHNAKADFVEVAVDFIKKLELAKSALA